MSTPIAQLYNGLRLQVLGVARSVNLAAAGTGVAFKVPNSYNALITHCLVENFSVLPSKVSGVTLSYGTLATAYADVFSAVMATSLGVVGFTISDGGTGYVGAPTVTLVSNDQGSGATATATLTADVVTSMTVTASGTGYSIPPTVVFTGANTTPAVATAQLGIADTQTAVTPIILLQPPSTAIVAAGFTVNWAITDAVTGAGTCDLTWLGGLV